METFSQSYLIESSSRLCKSQLYGDESGYNYLSIMFRKSGSSENVLNSTMEMGHITISAIDINIFMGNQAAIIHANRKLLENVNYLLMK